MNKSIPSSRTDRHLQFGQKKILEILQEIEGGLSRREACQQYGMAYSTLCEWFKRLGSDKYHSQKRQVFSVSQKRSVVRKIREGTLSKNEACLSLGISQKLLNSWILQFAKDDDELQSINNEVMSTTTISSEKLPPELSDAALKIKALETLIDLAEEQFNISIRKKSGAKQ